MIRGENLKLSEKTRAWLIVGSSFLMMFFIFATCISCMGIYLKPVTEAFGISRTEFSLTITIGSVAMMLSAITAGKMMTKYNIKYLMIIGVILCASSIFIYSIASTIILFYCGAVLMGISLSLTCNVPVSILINDWFETGKEGIALGIAFVGSGAGAMVLNPLYTYVIENVGWRGSFQLAALMIFLLIIPVILFVKRKKQDNKEKSAVAENQSMLKLSDILKLPATWCVFIGFIFIAFANMVILNHGIPFLTDNGVTAGDAALYISLASGALIIGKIILGKMIDKVGVYKATIFGSISMTVCIAALWAGGLFGSNILFGLFAIGYGLGAGVATVSMPVAISYMYNNCDFGAIMGFFCTTGGIGGIIQIIISIIYDASGNYNYAWMLTIAVCVLMVFLFALKMKPQKESL